MSLPWVESPFFENRLKEKHLSDVQAALAREFHENGFVVLKNIFTEEEIDNVIRDMDEKGFNLDFPASNLRDEFRVQDFWEHSKAIKNLSCKNEILNTLEMLYEREPMPFQTLNFKIGSRQAAHSDSIHFSSLPSRFMCGVWVALEDMTESNGTVYYCPGSQNLQEYDFTHIYPVPDRTTYDNYKDYEVFMEELVEKRNFKKVPFYAKKGDVLIWSSNIIHGGMPVLDENATRYSQVTHYYFKDCYYYVPMLSNMATREYFLRNNLVDIKTGRKMEPSYNGTALNQIQTEPGLFMLTNKLKRLPKYFRAIGYSGYYLK
jgi:hypothetical protein